jgi:hypothetical protein
MEEKKPVKNKLTGFFINPIQTNVVLKVVKKLTPMRNSSFKIT